MNILRLSFASSNKPELLMVEYLASTGEKRSSVRGKSGSITSDYNSFQWTSAVKALACLGLRANILGVSRASILGDAKSLASALDYAISKPPVWLIEMFGLDMHGEPFAKRLFKRINPERKRVGPVTINLNPRQFDDTSIEIWYGGSEVKEVNQVKALYYSVLDNFKIKEESLGASIESTFLNSEEHEIDSEEDVFLRGIYEEEIRKALFSPKVFSKNWTSSYLRFLSKDPLFLKVNSPHERSLNGLVDQDSTSVRLGLYDYTKLTDTLNSLPPIRIYTSICATGFIALCQYLKNVLHIPLDLRYYHSYGVEVVSSSKLFSKESDLVLCCTGLGPTAEFFNDPSKGYSPIMIGPAMSHGIVNSKLSKGKGEFLFVKENPTSALFCFDALLRAGKINQRDTNIRHCEPEDTILSLLEDPTIRSLMWFPHYKFLNYYAGLSISSDSSELFSQATVIFGNKALQKNMLALNCIKLIFRNAWLSMLEEPESIKRIARIMISDKNFVRFTKRCGGLHYLE